MSWFLAPQTPIVHGTDSPAGPRVGLTAGKVLGKAHERNRIKRRMREALRRHVDLLPQGCDLILHPRRTVLTMEFTKLEAEIVRILQQATVEAGRMAPRAARDWPRSMTRVLLAALDFYRRWISPAIHSLSPAAAATCLRVRSTHRWPSPITALCAARVGLLEAPALQSLRSRGPGSCAACPNPRHLPHEQLP